MCAADEEGSFYPVRVFRVQLWSRLGMTSSVTGITTIWFERTSRTTCLSVTYPGPAGSFNCVNRLPFFLQFHSVSFLRNVVRVRGCPCVWLFLFCALIISRDTVHSPISTNGHNFRPCSQFDRLQDSNFSGGVDFE